MIPSSTPQIVFLLQNDTLIVLFCFLAYVMALSQLMLYETSNLKWNDCYELSKDVLRNDKGIS